MISSVSALSMHTSAAILLDLARLFLDLMVMMQVLGNIIVSVLLPIVELLEFGTCSHPVSLLLEVLELVEGPESEDPRGDGDHRLCGQLRLCGLPSWVLLDRLHVNVLLVKLVGGLDSDSEGPCLDGEFGLGVQRFLGGLRLGTSHQSPWPRGS
jgi:hypothetical protein